MNSTPSPVLEKPLLQSPPPDQAAPPRPAAQRSRRAFLIALLAITVLAGGLRLTQLTGPSFWIDELFTIRSTALLHQGVINGRTLAYVPATIGLWIADINPGELDPEAFHTWQRAGINELNVRLPYTILAIVSLPLLVLASVRLIGPRAALIFGLLLAVSPWHLWMSQLGRMYGQQFLLYNLAFILFFIAVRPLAPPRVRHIACLAALVVASFWTVTGSLVILLVFAVDIAGSRFGVGALRLGRRFWIGAAAAVLACFAIWFAHFLTEPEQYTAFAGSKQSATDMLLGTPYMLGVPVAVLGMLTALWLLPRHPRLTVYLTAGAAVPLLVFMAMAAAGVDMHLRYTFVALYPWLALTALGAEALWVVLRPRVGPVLACTPIAVLVVASLFNDYAYFTGGVGYRARWREAFGYVAEKRAPGETVAADYIPSIVGSYYLQDKVQRLPGKLMPHHLDALPQPVWVVVRAHSATTSARFQWLLKAHALQTYFDSRILQPANSVHVYRYQTPAIAHAVAPAAPQTHISAAGVPALASPDLVGPAATR